MKKTIIIILVAITQFAFAQKNNFTESFVQENCEWVNIGRNQYFILEPNFQLTLQGKEGKDTTTLVITVKNETKKIGNVETRVVEEREWENGILIEVSQNYFAICKSSNTVFYFGEEVDNYKDGKVDNHSGSWLADQPGCQSGVQMPGIILLGSRYFQEQAPKTAMDKAEIISNTETMNTPAGNFTNVLKTEETTAMNLKEKEYKFYAPNIGLIKEGEMLLLKYGFAK